MKRILSPLLGALTVLAFAPFQWFPLAMLAPAWLESRIRDSPLKQSASQTCLFGLGFFGVGISWVFVSIHDHSDAPLWAAIAITALFVTALSSVLTLMGLSYSALMRRLPTAARWFVFPALWVIFEWVRTWLLTGFPWLLLGYTLIDTPLQSFAPIVGVYGLSFLCLLTGMMLFNALRSTRCRKISLLAGISALFILGLLLDGVSWTHPVGDKKVVGLVQGNIPQETKWDPHAADHHLEIYRSLTRGLHTSHIVIWPEAAFPYTLPSGRTLIRLIDAEMKAAHAALITGIVIEENPRAYTNSVIAIGENAEGRYDKHHLVPFGEFVPFYDWLGATFDWLQLPKSFTVPGAWIQPALDVQGLMIAPLICYEVVYPELARLRALESDVMLTVSNDTWFGKSLGPIQHLQMARMRALENGRWMIRGTNNGLTALIDPRGKIRHIAPSDEATTLTGVVQGYQGKTPIMWIGHERLLWGMLLVLTLVLILCRKCVIARGA